MILEVDKDDFVRPTIIREPSWYYASVDLPLHECSRHHVAETPACASDDAHLSPSAEEPGQRVTWTYLALHREARQRPLVMSPVTGSDQIVSRVSICPFLRV